MARYAHRAARLAAIVVVAVGLTGCSSGGAGTPAVAPSGSATALTDAQVLALGREVAQCFRDHGLSDYPDPGVNRGRLEFPRITVPRQIAQACADVVNRLPGSAFEKNEQRQLSSEDMVTLHRFAACIREHGATWFPDPQPNGDFVLTGTPMEHQIEPPPADYFAAEAKCRQFEGPGIYLEAGP